MELNQRLQIIKECYYSLPLRHGTVLKFLEVFTLNYYWSPERKLLINREPIISNIPVTARPFKRYFWRQKYSCRKSRSLNPI